MQSFLNQLNQIAEQASKQKQISPHLKQEIQNLSSYLKNQTLCDADRRDKQVEISSAVQVFVARLFETSLAAVYDQPQEFWNYLERLSGVRIRVGVRPKTDPMKEVSKWEARHLFEHLLDECNLKPISTERDECIQALTALIANAKTPRYKRDIKGDKQLWITRAYPFINRHGLLAPFKANTILKHRLNFHLTGQL